MTRAPWRLSGYRVEELLGAGATGDVWQARVTSTGIAVALKRVWMSDREQRKAALSEAAMLSALDHPHLMKLHEVRHLDDDAIVLVLDLAGGGSLDRLLTRRGRLTVGEVVTALAPIAAALAYAHHNGVVHGDVSAANVLFTDIGLPLLADLGVARLLGDANPARTTPAYADPTVAAGALPGPENDVFMLGAVALHALTGSPPWPGAAAAEVLEAAACGDPPDFAAQLDRAGVPAPVATVVARALSIEPGRRGTAADFALELRHAAQPVAVELTAGRARMAASSSGRVDSWPVQSVPASQAPSTPIGPRITFARQPLTEGVRAPVPFSTPPGRHLARARPRIATGPVLALVAAALTALALAWWWPAGTRHDPAAAGPPERASSLSTPSLSAPSLSAAADPTTAPPGSHPSSHPSRQPGTQPRTQARTQARTSMRAALADLDATRAAAYAQRAPALLAQVYAAPGLLARDRAQLLAIVPTGCGLRGVRTRFTHLTVARRSATAVTVRVRAALRPSQLVCADAATGRAPGTAAMPLRLRLVRHGAGYLIAAQQHD